MAVKLPAAVIATFLWIGFVGAISFMEAWLKFRAPGITIPLGLGIGRLVFNALNKVEWVMAVIIAVPFLLGKAHLLKNEMYLFLIPLVMLALQTVWLLPALDARAELHLQGAEVPASKLHFVYVAAEMIKVAGLFWFGLKLLKPQI